MINQKSNQLSSNYEQKLIGAIPLCSRCIVYEINNWIADKRGLVNPEASQQIREELKTIKLKSGECVVCNHSLISDNTFENILKIFEKHKVSGELQEEFRKLFGFID